MRFFLNSEQTRNRRELSQSDKGYLPKNLQLSSYLMVKDFSLRSGTRQGFLNSPLLFNIVLKILASAVVSKAVNIGKEKVITL